MTYWLCTTEATAVYSKGQAGSVSAQLDAVHEELAARIDGLDINGKPLDLPGLPSFAVMQSMQGDPALCQPLTDDIVTVSVTKSDGTVSRKNVKLGDSIEKLSHLLDHTEMRFERLIVDVGDITATIEEKLEDYDAATNAVHEIYREKMEVLKQDVAAFHKQTLEEIVKARKEDKAYTVEANRKLMEFAQSLY